VKIKEIAKKSLTTVILTGIMAVADSLSSGLAPLAWISFREKSLFNSLHLGSGGTLMSRRVAVALLATATLILCAASHTASAATLVGDPFASSYSGWTDAFPAPTRAGNWRLSLHNPTLMDTNNLNPPNSGATGNDGTYQPDVLYQNNFTATGTYDLSATMRTNDDDIIGLVFNYQDPSNYFRVGIRQQPGANGSFGGTDGLAVQKIVGGVVTQISPAGTGAGALSPITQAMIDSRTAFNLKVAVSGTNYSVLFNNTSIVSGSDALLANGGKIGISSWAQLSDVAAVTPFWGTEVEQIQVDQGGGTVYSETFNFRPVAWRQVVMTNGAGVKATDTGVTKEALGNFGRAINDPWIHQDSNGNLNATTGTVANPIPGNIDFIGPGVVVNEPGATAFTDYEMKVRLGAADNDGYGVLVRVLDDNNFYRINFHADPAAIAGTRPPRGVSVQKVRNGVWSELYRDNQASIPFLPPVGAVNTTPSTPGFPMFDLKVDVIGNTLTIHVDDLLGNHFDYSVVDGTNPIPSGTVGFTTWGSEDVYYMGYGGGAGAPLLVEVPEPAAVCLALLAAVGMCSLQRRRAA
jgi:hypothetical protein